MTNRPAPPGEQPRARLEEAALAIALAERPPPRERARCFEGGNLEAAVSIFRRKFGELPAGRLDAARRWRDTATAAGRRLLILGQPGFPPPLTEIAVPPIALESAGDADLAAPGVAVVGSRRATPYG
ncbi:MAG: hypothetical protein F4198_11890, partial [Acidobacteria bacterium]|nr:hypothetical protein [Acidobacteriota bacterium]